MSLELLKRGHIGDQRKYCHNSNCCVGAITHLRASNRIQGQLAINALIQSVEFWDAQTKIESLSAMLNDPVSRGHFVSRCLRSCHKRSSQCGERLDSSAASSRISATWFAMA